MQTLTGRLKQPEFLSEDQGHGSDKFGEIMQTVLAGSCDIYFPSFLTKWNFIYSNAVICPA